MSSDNDLVLQAQQGDAGAFSVLVERHYRPVVKLAYYFLHDWSDAEDQAQNTFLKAFVALHQFERNAKFSTWLMRIVQNECMMRFRENRTVRLAYLSESVTAEGCLSRDVQSPSADPEEDLWRRQFQATLSLQLGRVPKPYRSVLRMLHERGMSIGEIAQTLGMSVSAVKSRLRRARLEMRRRLEGECGKLDARTLPRHLEAA